MMLCQKEKKNKTKDIPTGDAQRDKLKKLKQQIECEFFTAQTSICEKRISVGIVSKVKWPALFTINKGNRSVIKFVSY